VERNCDSLQQLNSHLARCVDYMMEKVITSWRMESQVYMTHAWCCMDVCSLLCLISTLNKSIIYVPVYGNTEVCALITNPYKWYTFNT